jgi:hypothetical protein
LVFGSDRSAKAARPTKSDPRIDLLVNERLVHGGEYF